jgi:hypothetical protein
MQVTANVECRKQVIGSLARHAVERRRRLNWDARPSTECISKKAAPRVSPIASDKLSEAEALQRAGHGDAAAFEYLYRLHSRRVYAVCLRLVGNTAEAEGSRRAQLHCGCKGEDYVEAYPEVELK